MPGSLRIAAFLLFFASLAVAPVCAQAQAKKKTSPAPATGQTRVFALADTIYLKTKTLAEALQREPEFAQLNLTMVENRLEADIIVEVKRSHLTWDWSYTVIDNRNGRQVNKGKMRTVTPGGAMNVLGPLIMRDIAFALGRPLPASAAATVPAPETEPAVKPPTPVAEAAAVPNAAALESELRSAATLELENLDRPVPTGAKNPHAYALVMGAENYRAPIPEVPFAINDATVMKRYFEAVLGVPAANIRGVPNPALTDLKVSLMWLRNQVLTDGSPDAVAYVYYAGHGMPDVATGKPYLMPVDANPDYISETGFAVDSLVAELAPLPAHSVILLDACFTGTAARAKGSSAGLTLGKRPAFVEAQMPSQTGRVSVFSAVTGRQTSNALHPAYHGLFTYYVLKGLHGDAADAQRRITLAGLHRYVAREVTDAAARMNQTQTPTLSGPADLVLVSGLK